MIGAITALLLLAGPPERPRAPVVVASKPFGESYLLAEMTAQLLESHGVRVERRPGLGSTAIAFGALQTGAIDVYPEYTGTGLRVILGDSTTGASSAEVYRRVAESSLRRWGIRWLAPLGFENTYAIVVRRRTADSLGLASLSDLGTRGATLRAGLTADFLGRADGLPLLRSRTGWQPQSARPMGATLKYNAIATGAVDLIDGYSTDGRLADERLVVLRDDARIFPPYDAALVVGARLAATQPTVVALLATLSGRLPVARVREWNHRIELGGESVAVVAGEVLREIGLAGPPRTPERETSAAWWPSARQSLLRYLLQHLLLVMLSLGAATLVGGAAGLWLGRRAAGEGLVLRALGAVQTVPGLALLALCIPVLGIGQAPAVAALWLYALYPITQATVTGLRQVDPRLLDTGTSLGLTELQRLRFIALPLAAPSILAGIRTATVLTIGGATLAAFVGGGGLGEPIMSGLSLGDHRLVLLGALPAALVALVADAALAALGRQIRPAHLVTEPAALP